MNKKILFTLSLLSILVFLSGCGGGGGGSVSAPPGTNSGVPSVIKLLDVQNIAQTNSTIFLKAKVLDGNGTPVQNVPVTFTNLTAPFGQLSATIVNTDANGIATVTLNSAVPGFATIAVELNSAAGQIRDKRTVFFTANIELAASMFLDVESLPGDGMPNQPSDFILFEGPNDDTVEVLATVFDAGGFPVGAGIPVSWSADETEVVFQRIETSTNVNGRAKAIVQVVAGSLRAAETSVNIGAFAGNGSANMVTLFLLPVTVKSVVVTSNPSTVASAGTSEITASVTTTAGTPVPDGTTVNFTSTAGTLSTLFAQTTDGVATTTLTAPNVTSDTGVSVTASVGGKSGSTSVKVTGTPAALTLTASGLTVDGNTGGTVTFTVSGGASTTYTSTSASPLLAFNDNGTGIGGVANDGVRESGEGGIWTGASFKATIESCTPAGPAIISATDGTTTVTKTITIQNVAGTIAEDRPTISPATATICENTAGCSAGVTTATYTLTLGAGATSPVTVTSSNVPVIANPGSIVIPPGTFIVDANAITADTTVNLKVTNNLGCKAGATVKVINEP